MEGESPNWLELPDDITANILHRLGAKEILESAQKVCTAWRRICNEPTMWRVIDMWSSWKHVCKYDIKIMCRHAIDRSHGQLEEIKLPYWANDELLLYIGKRCNNLKCLRLAFCFVSLKVLTKVLEKSPNLEELHLFWMSPIFDEDTELKSIGIACPNLKTFIYHGRQHIFPRFADVDHRNDIAMAVAKSMHNLLHLRLSADMMNNEGLEAILNCCPHLESLDIRVCFGVDLSGELGRRCLQQIKHLRLPNDSTNDYEWKN